MTALVASLIAFALGAALGLLRHGAPDRDQERGPISHGTAVVALFAALVIVPSNAYFLAFAGDWAYGYFLDSRAVPSAFELCLVLADGVAVLAGYAAARRTVRAGSLAGGMLLGGIPAAVALVVLVACHRRLGIDASFQQVRLDFGTQPVAGGRLGYAVLWMLAMVIAGFVISARALGPKRASRPLAAPSRRAGLRPSAFRPPPR